MALTITIPGGAIQLSDTLIRVKVNTDTVTGSLYKVLLKVTPENDEHLPGGPFEEEKDPDDNGDAWFEISGLLRRIFVPGFNIENGTLHTERDDTPYKIALDIGESYVDDSNERQENWAELEGDEYEVLLLRGGLSNHRQNIYNQLGTNFYQDYIVGGKWLTELPSPLKITTDKLVKLWYLTSETEQQSLILNADYTLQDGTTGTVSFDVTVNPEVLNEFDVDPLTLGLTITGDNPVASYSVYLTDADDTPVTEEFEYEIDYSYYEENYQVLYMNKFSGIDPLWFHGKVTNQFSGTHETGQRTPEVDDNTFTRTTVISSKTGRRKWIMNFGYKSYEEIMALQSLILSRQVWIIDDGYAVPVNIEENEEDLAAISDDVHEYKITFIEAHENKYM